MRKPCDFCPLICPLASLKQHRLINRSIMTSHPFVARGTNVDELWAAPTTAVFDAVMRGSPDNTARVMQPPDPNANETRDEFLVRIRHGQDNSTWRPATEADFGIEPASTDEKKNPQPVCEKGIPPAAPQRSAVEAHQTDEQGNANDSASDGDEDDVLFLPHHDDQLSCTDSSCYACAQRACPHHEPLHYHHDGCPACWNKEQRQERAEKPQAEVSTPSAAAATGTVLKTATLSLESVRAEAWYPTAERAVRSTGRDDLCCPNCYTAAKDVKPSQ